MSATIPPRHRRADLSETRFAIQRLMRDEDQPLDKVGDDPEQLETLAVLLDSAHELLKHAEAIAGSIEGASLSPPELALVRVMIEADAQEMADAAAERLRRVVTSEFGRAEAP